MDTKTSAHHGYKSKRERERDETRERRVVSVMPQVGRAGGLALSTLNIHTHIAGEPAEDGSRSRAGSALPSLSTCSMSLVNCPVHVAEGHMDAPPTLPGPRSELAAPLAPRIPPTYNVPCLSPSTPPPPR